MKYCISFLILLFFTSGCASLPTAKDVCNHLESIPTNTPIVKLQTSSVSLVKISPYNTPKEIPNSIDSWLLINPLKFETLTLYRQWPYGILANLSSSDLSLPLDVKDSINTGGSVIVFFDKTKTYKGYFAYSYRSYSKDDKDRLEKEKESYQRAGFEKMLPEVKQRLKKKRQAGSEWPTHTPILPLSNRISEIK